MKLKVTLLLCAVLLTGNVWAQDVPDVVWKSPMSKVYPTGEAYNLPFAQDQVNYQNPNTTTRVVNTGEELLVLPPNVRPFPHTATQSEVDAANMTGNGQIVFASWNSFGPSFWGTGYATSINGGTSWTGNFQMFTPNNGDPAAWVWPAGSTWAGRYGMSVISHASFSTNNGVNWSSPVPFSPGGGSAFDKNFSAVDNVTGSPFFGRAYTVWTDFTGSSNWKIRISFTTDGGATWSPSTYVSPNTSPGHHHQGCDIKVGLGGAVHVVWANCITNGQNSTEDSLGYARSTDGGVSWVVSRSNACDMNGIRALPLFNGIRASGFPRLAIDLTGGSRNGWLYSVAGEKTLAPAGDVSDVVLCRSTDNGTTWTRIKVNQDPSNGRYNYMPAAVVTPDGGLNVSYYDQRNTTGFVTEYWMSRSLNGGASWTDVAVSDHSFTPAAISGLNTGYQGDYTGITFSSGSGKIYPFWADNSSGIYQVWTDGITYGPPPVTLTNRALRLPSPGVNTNYVSIPHNSGMVGFPNITIEAWVKTGSNTAPNIILNKGTSSFDYQFGIVPFTNNPYFRAQGIIIQATTMNVIPNVWTHLAVTYDGTAVKFYKDGLMGFSQNSVSPLGSSTNEMNIGRGVNDPFAGNIEELRLWTVARTPGAIDSNKCRKFPSSFSSSAGLRALWHFDSTAVDSISSFNGTLQGTAGYDTVSFPIPGANCNLVGLQTVNSEIPVQYLLEQNYPNPFNPVTNIRFSIPKDEFVEIVIFDITGKEIAIVVSEPLQAGYFELDFDASGLASGIYFYKISAGKFSEVKKMVLIK